MKDMKLLVWLTQLALSLVVPLGSFLFLGLWLHRSLGWGRWALIVCILLGLYTGLHSLWTSLQTMLRMDRSDPKPPPQAFNDHT